MENITKLLSDLQKHKEKYSNQRKKKNFNIFTALHKEHDEVRLHSRFISYLLSPSSEHGMGSEFAKILIKKILKIDETQFQISGYEVIPNEKNKSEFKEIDILIINKQTKQAIIIENKIFAKDSNTDHKKEGYNGQLERYYNTIKTGIDVNNNELNDYKCNSVYIYFLTIDKGRKPSTKSIGMLKDIDVLEFINYEVQILSWLKLCLEIIPKENLILKGFVQHYINLINKMTNNDIPIKERKDLQEKIGHDWESTKYLIENFKHVKWHTAFDFWDLLMKKLEKKYLNVSFYPDEITNSITKLTHSQENLNYGIRFSTKTGKEAYISGDNSLSWGILEVPKRWSYFKNENLENINFTTFSTENTFRLINKDNLTSTVSLILEEIEEAESNQFSNMKTE